MAVEQWTLLTYLQAGAYIAIMLAALGVAPSVIRLF